MNKAYIWQKNDKITADRLNTMSAAVNCLACAAGVNLSCKGKATGQTSNMGSAQQKIQPIRYDGDTKLYNRHPYLGTADIVGDQEPGYYATPPRVVRGDGEEAYSVRAGACHIAPCAVGKPGTATELYVQFCTNNVGLISGSPVYTWCKANCTQLFGLSRGAGFLSYPVAKIVSNPKYPCEKIALNNNAPIIPLIADDASYLPPFTTGNRVVQGAKWVDNLLNAVIPVRGLNNWGGVKLLGIDTDGLRKSNAVEASIEMYGLAAGSQKKEYEEKTYPYCIPCDLVGTGAGQFPKRCVWLYSPYNWCQPYKISGDGLLAKWPVYEANGEHQGDLKLIGRHFCDWQLVFQGMGCIHLHCQGATARGGTTTNQKTNIRIYTEAGQNYLAFQPYQRQECFGKSGAEIYYNWGCWQPVGSEIAVPVGGDIVGTRGVEIRTIAGSRPDHCKTRWDCNTLILVQQDLGCGFKLV